MSDLKSKVEGWLAKHGYPLEFETATIIRSIGPFPKQGIYVDVENKPREIDVLVDIDEYRHGVMTRISYVFECKSGSDKPWVLLRHHDMRTSEPRHPATLITSELADAVLWEFALAQDFESYELFEKKGLYAFSAVRAFAEADVCYPAIQSVIAKTAALAASHDRLYSQGLPKAAFVGFPIIVIDSPLFIAGFNEEKSAMETEQVGHAQLTWRGSDAWSHPVVIDVVNISHLEGFFRERMVAVKAISDYIVERAHLALDAYRKPHEVTAALFEILVKRQLQVRKERPRLARLLEQNSRYRL